MTDHGVVCYGEYQGEKVLGMRLNWNKRYITLAPIATVIGLAFKLYDPDHLLGSKENIGITCALIPRQTPGITIGRRHFPLNTPFQNGPTQEKTYSYQLILLLAAGKKRERLAHADGIARRWSRYHTAIEHNWRR